MASGSLDLLSKTSAISSSDSSSVGFTNLILGDLGGILLEIVLFPSLVEHLEREHPRLVHQMAR